MWTHRFSPCCPPVPQECEFILPRHLKQIAKPGWTLSQFMQTGVRGEAMMKKVIHVQYNGDCFKSTISYYVSGI